MLARRPSILDRRPPLVPVPVPSRGRAETSAPNVDPTLVAVRRQASATLFGQTMGYVALTSGLFAVGVYLGRDTSGMWALLWFLAAVGVLFGMRPVVRRGREWVVGLLCAFGMLIGLAVAPAITYYLDSDPQPVWAAGIATALFMAGAGVAGYTTRRDLAVLERSLLRALVGLIAFGIVLVFVQIPGGAVVYSLLGLVVFAGLTMLDFQRIRRGGDIETAPLLAASIFLDALNVFFFFLTLFSGDR
jgi:modulator of FtsH protease